MEIEIKIGGLDSLAAAIKEAAACNLEAARLTVESRSVAMKGFSDALQIVLPAIVSGRFPARAFEPDTPEAGAPAPAAEAIQPRPAAGSVRSQGEDAEDENPVNARGSREARQVVGEKAPEAQGGAATPSAESVEAPVTQGGAATPPVTMNDVMAVCECLKKDFPEVFTRQFAREFATSAFKEAGLVSTPKTDAEVARLFEIVSLKEREFRRAHHG